MKKLFYILPLLFLFACQIEDENAPKPSESFIKYLGALADQEAKDIEPIWNADSSDVTGFVILGTQEAGDSARNFYVVRTDALGNLVYENTFGRDGFPFGDINNDGTLDISDLVDPTEEAAKIRALNNGMFLVVGTSSFSNNILGASDFKFVNIVLLDAELEVVGDIAQIRADTTRNQMTGFPNFTRDMIVNDVLVLSDNTLLLVGALENVAETDFDFYIRKFDASTVYWEKTVGFGAGNDDVLVRGFENDDRTISLFGYSQDPGMNGEAGTNVTFLKVNENGNVLNSNSNGIEDPSPLTPYDDVLNDVIEIPGGYAAVGTTTTSDNETYSFFMSLSIDGIANFSDTLKSDFSLDGTNDTQLETLALGITATATNDFAIVGSYSDFRVGTESRGAEGMFFRVNQVGEKVVGAETNFGIGDGNDSFVDAITLPDGKIVVASTIDFGGGIKMISLIKLNDSGKLDR